MKMNDAAESTEVQGDPIVIIGTGFAGLGMGIRLKQAGIHDFVILERAASVGGTWRDNHYPGAECDVQSHLYSFSFEPNPGWSKEFAAQKEILGYLERCAEKYGLLPHIKFDTEVVSARFDERAAMWDVATRGGETFRARVLVSGSGGLSKPNMPEIPGLETFRGALFHSARWNHDFDLTDKVVGVIGTGASSVQIVPAIQPTVRRLDVFQRTAPWITPKPDRRISRREQALFARFPLLQKAARASQYWRREVLAVGFVKQPKVLKALEPLVRFYIERAVKDPVLRQKVTPDYRLGCKRILPTNTYYRALQKPNVELITGGIEAIVPEGIRTHDGQTHVLDAIVCATGFEAAEAVAPVPLQGRGGKDLEHVWVDGAEAYLGSTVSGFPNFFMIVGPNTGLGHSSMVFMIEAQIAYTLDAIQQMRQKRLRTVEVKRAAQTAYNREIHARLANTVWSTGCVSWYRTRSGKNTVLWPGYTFEFRRRTRVFDLASYDVVQADAERPVPLGSPASAHI